MRNGRARELVLELRQQVGGPPIFPVGADKASLMTKLLWTLARHDCPTAQLLLVLGDHPAAAIFLLRATELLECRARSRDPGDPWEPVLAERKRDRGNAGGVS